MNLNDLVDKIKNKKINKIYKISFFLFIIIICNFFLETVKFSVKAEHISLNSFRYSNLTEVINKTDKTTYDDLVFIKKETRSTADGRYGNGRFDATFFIFKAKYKIGNDIEILVNSEFETHEKVAEVALRFSKMAGQLPVFLKKKIKWIIIHGPWVDKSKCTCRWYAFRDAGIYIHTEMVEKKEQEETLIHEAGHVSIDSRFYGSHNHHIWENAQKLDNNYISHYAKEFPDREDIAESILAWVSVRCKESRISKLIKKDIIKTIPNRLKILDNLINKYETYPLTCKF
tara:strand:+ start:643 stop:1503 length:861 start_codon:yes stop_codon:yes gene_type:complete